MCALEYIRYNLSFLCETNMGSRSKLSVYPLYDLGCLHLLSEIQIPFL